MAVTPIVLSGNRRACPACGCSKRRPGPPSGSPIRICTATRSPSRPTPTWQARVHLALRPDHQAGREHLDGRGAVRRSALIRQSRDRRSGRPRSGEPHADPLVRHPRAGQWRAQGLARGAGRRQGQGRRAATGRLRTRRDARPPRPPQEHG